LIAAFFFFFLAAGGADAFFCIIDGLFFFGASSGSYASFSSFLFWSSIKNFFHATLSLASTLSLLSLSFYFWI
jgi:hypothetical protein